LIKLDLSSNALSSVSGAIICNAIKESISLTDVNFARNVLCDYFAECLANTFRVNNVLWRVDISDNKITQVGAKMILDAINEENDSI
jgi:Ran GTPase-activating protein (RanGAP) involved in mRNA processing and transport